MRKRETKTFKFKMTESKDDLGIVEGYASVFGNVDQGGDIVEKGSFKRTIDMHGGKFKTLWNHDYKSPPIGISHVQEDDKGLFTINTLFVKSMDLASNVFTAIKGGAIDSFSFMYDVIQSEAGTVKGEPVRLLKELKLFEVSPVNFPMNEQAVITGFKSENFDDLAERILEIERQIKTQSFSEVKQKFDLFSEKFNALCLKFEELSAKKALPTDGLASSEDVKMVGDLVAKINADLAAMSGSPKSISPSGKKNSGGI